MRLVRLTRNIPEGELCSRKKDDYRTFRVNKILKLISSFSSSSGENKKGKSNFLLISPLPYPEPESNRHSIATIGV